MDDKEVGAIVAEIEGGGSLEAFFNNPKAINDLVKTLLDKGNIGWNDGSDAAGDEKPAGETGSGAAETQRQVDEAVKAIATEITEKTGVEVPVDTKKMKPDAPLRDYTHLWVEGLKAKNPEEWENVKKLFDKVEGLKEEVQKLYPELKGDDLYEEMITTFSGREGAKKLEQTVRELAAKEGKSVTESAKAQGFVDKVREGLQRFWKGVADMLHIHFTTAEEVADKVLADWAKGVDRE